MTIAKMTAVMLGFTAVGALLGGAIGYLLGLFAPDFYASTIGPGNPVQIGVGFGVAQGLTMGFVFACLVLILAAILKRRQGC